MQEEPQARRAPRHRRGLRRHPGAGRLQGPRRAARPRRLAGDGPQRHGGARGGGLHHPAAHQRRPGPHRQGLPALRRPAHHASSRCAPPRSARSPRSSTARSTSTTSSSRSVRLLAQLTRQVAVVQYPTLSRSTVRHVELVALAADPAAGGADPEHRPGRAAPRRARPRRSTTTTLADAARAASTAAATGEIIADAADRAARRCRCAHRTTPATARRSSPSPRRGHVATTAPTSGSRSAAPPTWPASATASTSAVRPLLEALEEHVVLLKLLGEAHRPATRHGAHRPRGPLRGARRRPASSPPATAPATRRSASLGIVGPTRMDYPARWPRCAPSPATSILDDAWPTA